MIIGIAAVDNKWGLGRSNQETGKGELLFSLKKDMQFFQDTTKAAGIVVFGENTYLSLPKRPLKNRVNIVLCPEGHEYDDCICFHDFFKLLNFIQIISKRFDVCICGGGMLYKSMLPYYDKVYVNKVDADGEAEVFFPNLDTYEGMRLSKVFPEVEDGGYLTKLHLYTRVDKVEEEICR